MPTSPTQGADWVNVSNLQSNWVQCKKCGTKPRGQPAMACSKCKSCHGEWSPNPLGLLIQAQQHHHAVAKQLGAAQSQLGTMRKNKSDLSKEIQTLESQLRDAEDATKRAELERDAAELKGMRKGPATRARGSALVGKTLDEVENLTKQLTEATENAGRAQGEVEKAQVNVSRLEESTLGLDADVRALHSENDRLKEALLDACRGNSPLAPAQGGISNDIAALIARGAAASGTPAPMPAYQPPPVQPYPQQAAAPAQLQLNVYSNPQGGPPAGPPQNQWQQPPAQQWGPPPQQAWQQPPQQWQQPPPQYAPQYPQYPQQQPYQQPYGAPQQQPWGYGR
jgi:hypothetical protein